MKRIFAFTAVLSLFAAFNLAPAHAATTVSVANSSLSGISNDGLQGTQYDVLSIIGNTTSFNATPAGSIDLGTLIFSDGPSTFSPAGTVYQGSFSFDVNVDGMLETLTMPYMFVLNGGNHGQDDVITLKTGDISFKTSDGTVTITTLETTMVGSYPGTTTHELIGNISDVPEPGSLALLGTGLIGTAASFRRLRGR